LLDCKEEILSFLKEKSEKFNVVVMPDFFLDRIITLKWNLEKFSENLKLTAEKKGGCIDEIEQTELRGGNAINTASALAALNVKVTPITCTNKLGLQLLKFYFKPYKIDFSHTKIFDKPSLTTAIEFKTENGKTNAMLRNVGALTNFGPQHLNAEDFEAIENADYVCLFNWAATKKFGTKLALTIFNHVKVRGKGKTYYDTADPTPNNKKIAELVQKILKSHFLDILSVNENEAFCYATQLDANIRKLKEKLQFEELAKKSAKTLSAHFSARVDLHTTSFSATFTRKTETIVPIFKVPVLRTTGAGDAWNAGNILGDAAGLSDAGRLTLANAVAAFYISNPTGMHATREQLIKFCEKRLKNVNFTH